MSVDYRHMHHATALRQRMLQEHETGEVPTGFVPGKETLAPHQFVQVYEDPSKFPPPAIGEPDGLGGVVQEPLKVQDPNAVGSTPEGAPVVAASGPAGALGVQERPMEAQATENAPVTPVAPSGPPQDAYGNPLPI